MKTFLFGIYLDLNKIKFHAVVLLCKVEWKRKTFKWDGNGEVLFRVVREEVITLSIIANKFLTLSWEHHIKED